MINQMINPISRSFVDQLYSTDHPTQTQNYLKEFKKTHQLIQNNKKFGQSFAFIVSTFFTLIGRPAQPQITILFTAALQKQPKTTTCENWSYQLSH